MTKKLVSDSPEYPERRRIEREVEEAINTAESDIDTLETEMDAAEADIATINTSGSTLHQTISTYGSGLYLNGVDAYAEAGGNYDGDIGAMDRAWTISFWFRHWWNRGESAASLHEVFVSKATALGNVQGYQIRYRKGLSSGPQYLFNLSDGTNDVALQFVLDPEDSLEDDRKIHRVDVYNDGTGNIELYLDNTMKDSSASALTLGPVARDTPLTFGRVSGASAHYAHIDAVAFCIQWDTTAAPTDMAVPSWKSAELDPSNFLLYDFGEGYGSESAPWPLARRDYMHFDGVDAEISIPDHASLNPTSITAEALAKQDNTSNIQSIFAKVDQYWLASESGDDTWSLALWDSVAFQAGLKNDTPGKYGVFHALGTYDETKNEGSNYTDGEFQSLKTQVSGQIQSSANPLFVGSFGGSSRYFAGTIFAVRLWSDERTAAEALGDYRTWHRDGDWYSALQLQLLFDDQTGTTVTDHSSNGHTATAAGGYTWGTNRLTLTNAQWIPAGQIAADEVQHA